MDNVTMPPASNEEVIEAERLEEPDTPFAGSFVRGDTFFQGPAVFPKAPVATAWICLAVAWFFFASQMIFSVVLAIPFDLAAIVLAMVCLSRGRLFTGIAILFFATVGSLVIYLVSLAIFFGTAAFG